MFQYQKIATNLIVFDRFLIVVCFLLSYLCHRKLIEKTYQYDE